MTEITIDLGDPALVVRHLRSATTISPAPADRAATNRLATLIEQAYKAVDRPREPSTEQTGAVIRDGGDDLWVWCSAGADGAFWRRVSYPEEVWRRWIDIPPPVTILSDGVSNS